MSNNLLHKAIRKNPITLSGKSNLLTDELFGIVRLTVKENGSIWTTRYTPLNYSSALEFQSHHKSHGAFYYNNRKQRTIYIMLDHIETVDIDMKQDNLRKALRQ